MFPTSCSSYFGCELDGIANGKMDYLFSLASHSITNHHIDLYGRGAHIFCRRYVKGIFFEINGTGI